MQNKTRAWLTTGPGMALLATLTALALYLLVAHTAHVLTVLPFLALLLCPLMHVFMMRGHGGPGKHDGHDSPGGDPPRPPMGGAA